MYVCPECGTSAQAPGACPRDGHGLVAADDPLLGQRIGNYLVARVIGTGGMGKVYLGVQPQIESRVAIKVLNEECARDRGLVERFFSEARAVNVIRHESIVSILDINQLPDGRPYIVMELLDGESVGDLIRRGPIPFSTLCHAIAQVLRGLDAAHEKGIIHRDLKPDNLFMSGSGRAKILDFGIAKLVPELGAVSEGTKTGSLIGTPYYMAPEQALARPVDARSDIYSVGIILYEAVTGRRPFQGQTLYELLKQHVEVDPPAPSRLRPEVPPALEAVIQRAMAKNPSQRFQSAGEFASALEAAASGVMPAMSQAPTAAAPNYGPASYGAPTPHTAPAPYAPSGYGTPPPYTLPSAVGAPPAPPYAPAAGGYAPHAPSLPGQTAPVATRSGVPMLALAGCGLLLLGALVVGVVLIVLRSSTESLTSTTATPAPVATPLAIVPNSPQTTPLNASNDSFDSKRFDASVFFAKAQATARDKLPDAELIAEDLIGVSPTGFLNFELQSNSMALFRFRSAARSQPPTDFPKNATFESNCVVMVMVQKTGITTVVPDRGACNEPVIGKPKCSIKQVWEKAAKQGAPVDNVIGSVGVNGRMGQGGETRWYVQVPPNFTTLIADDCR